MEERKKGKETEVKTQGAPIPLTLKGKPPALPHPRFLRETLAAAAGITRSDVPATASSAQNRICRLS